MKNVFLLFIVLVFSSTALSQHIINGSFSALGNQSVRLVGFNGFEIYTIDSVRASANGAFSLSFSTLDYGMAYLATDDNKSFFVLLGDETMYVSGESFAIAERIRITGSPENELFGRYATEHPRREQALSAWDYLQKIYLTDSLFALHKRPTREIERERKRIKAEDQRFLASLDPNSYVSWYLPMRKLVSSVATIAQYRTEELPATIEAFRRLDYTEQRLYKSGLLRDAIDAHFWLIENSGRSLDSVYLEMGVSIDRMMESLVLDPLRLEQITDYLFKLLERRSLFGASEYLALKVLTELSCTVNDDLTAQMESYRAMKIGAIAPDILFNEGDVLMPAKSTSLLPGMGVNVAEGQGGQLKPMRQLSELKSLYTVVVFGASWCQACHAELSQLAALYPNWKPVGVEVVFVSLDESQQDFHSFSANLPFVGYCDYQKWGSPAVKAYHVFATPTIYLLDANRTIVLRPHSVSQLNAWVDWFLIKQEK